VPVDEARLEAKSAREIGIAQHGGRGAQRLRGSLGSTLRELECNALVVLLEPAA